MATLPDFTAIQKQAPKATETEIAVWFQHDLEDSWYEARFPNPKHDGSYTYSQSITTIAKKNGWAIVWHGDNYYNPWKVAK